MTEYIAKKLNLDFKKAKELQTNYFHKYNTSLNGLMIHHNINPSEFLKYVHEINLDFMKGPFYFQSISDLKVEKVCLSQRNYFCGIICPR